MALLLPYIHQIAIEKQSDAVLIMFRNEDGNPDIEHIRSPMIDWLEDREISWRPCMGFYRKGVIDEAYAGGIFVDVPYDLDDNKFMSLVALLDNDDITVQLCVCTMAEAKKDARAYKAMLDAI